MKSIDVVTAVLEYMIIHIKTKSGLQGLPLTLKFVLTIPTCGCTESRTFMREAAIKVIMVFHFVYFEAYPIKKKESYIDVRYVLLLHVCNKILQ